MLASEGHHRHAEPALRLAESAGLHDLLDAGLSLGSPNATAKTTSVVGGMLAGADCIDDLDLLRHGGMPRLFAGVRGPSTLGTSCARSPTGTCSNSTPSAGDSLPG